MTVESKPNDEEAKANEAEPESVDALDVARAVFAGHEEQRGRPEMPTQAGFRALADAGRDVWNAWRAEWPRPPPRFRGEVFEKLADFRGFRFNGIVEPTSKGSAVDFTDAHFKSTARFDGARFGLQAYFMRARFDNGALFRNAHFAERASFFKARLGSASFESALFGIGAGFNHAQLAHEARFEGAQFGAFASFYCTQFDGNVRFDGAQFGNDVTFARAIFGADALFRAWDEDQILGLWLQCDAEAVVAERFERATQLGLRCDAFRDIVFSGARFVGRVSFQSREFRGKTNFGPSEPDAAQSLSRQVTRFEGVPEFHGCKLHQDTSFRDAEFVARTPDAARAYRTLKLAMAQQQAVREEQFFFRLEMEIETELERGARRLIFKAYEGLADFGFSLVRPLYLWLGCMLVFGLAHAALAGPTALEVCCGRQPILQLGHYLLLNGIPLPGFDKVQADLRNDLFGFEDGAVLIHVTLDPLHKASALLSLFLAGLALRNLFKMKG